MDNEIKWMEIFEVCGLKGMVEKTSIKIDQLRRQQLQNYGQWTFAIWSSGHRNLVYWPSAIWTLVFCKMAYWFL